MYVDILLIRDCFKHFFKSLDFLCLQYTFSGATFACIDKYVESPKYDFPLEMHVSLLKKKFYR